MAANGSLNTVLMTLEHIKQKLWGFEYRVRLEDTGTGGQTRMTGLIWMTGRQRRVLARRGVVIFYDGTRCGTAHLS